MTHAERHIVETYSALFESLSAVSKLELLERLTKSIKKGRRLNEKDFFSSFGGFASDRPAEEINKDIRESRKFRTKDLKIVLFPK
ncbi:hypothetical protein [Cyclobacterium amurskyense]|uniref:Uncharacterized protein n=1 Tax=Cyclobacterium amurskyense TaxID=320787 RepID=A0A0H4PIW5_9BACT|nr:hypothetical protein [Cyclobacterium amurskyense]AKP52878.1 hypothetical protein CA2015_3495 [Cyclobacterium amurskyense]